MEGGKSRKNSKVQGTHLSRFQFSSDAACGAILGSDVGTHVGDGSGTGSWQGNAAVLHALTNGECFCCGACSNILIDDKFMLDFFDFNRSCRDGGLCGIHKTAEAWMEEGNYFFRHFELCGGEDAILCED